jgi:catechol 2,3-dioxygenase-like lactoylglutathione lyase family enzyme
VLTVRDVEETCHFYTEVLGLDVVTFGEDRKALLLGNQKIHLHEFGREYKPHAKYPSPGSADLCFLTELQMQHVVEQLAEKKVKIVDGPVQRSGTQGSILSVYIKDPDGNLIEIANQMSTSTRD